VGGGPSNGTDLAGLSAIEGDNPGVARNVGSDGFDLVMRTWGDTRIPAVEVGWLAHGE
jgi:hypothetical protein